MRFLSVMLQQEYHKKKAAIEKRLQQFKQIPREEYFYEICFCLLTPQSSAHRADYCIKQLKKQDFQNRKVNPLSLLKQKIRFHNHKTQYLLDFKKNHKRVFHQLNKVQDSRDKRDFLISNVKGLGLKESSHFLRNTGHENLAILDRHILKNLREVGAIKEVPKILTRKKYLEIERQFQQFSKKIKISMDHLDLLFWSQETGEIFK